MTNSQLEGALACYFFPRAAFDPKRTFSVYRERPKCHGSSQIPSAPLRDPLIGESPTETHGGLREASGFIVERRSAKSAQKWLGADLSHAVVHS